MATASTDESKRRSALSGAQGRRGRASTPSRLISALGPRPAGAPSRLATSKATDRPRACSAADRPQIERVGPPAATSLTPQQAKTSSRRSSSATGVASSQSHPCPPKARHGRLCGRRSGRVFTSADERVRTSSSARMRSGMARLRADHHQPGARSGRCAAAVACRRAPRRRRRPRWRSLLWRLSKSPRTRRSAGAETAHAARGTRLVEDRQPL